LPYAYRQLGAAYETTTRDTWEKIRAWAHHAAGEKSHWASWPGWSEENKRLLLEAIRPEVTIVGDIPPAHAALIKQLRRHPDLAGHLIIEYEHTEVIPNETQAKQSLGEQQYAEIRALAYPTRIFGACSIAPGERGRHGGRTIIYDLGRRSSGVLAEEVAHLGLHLIRATEVAVATQIEAWRAARFAAGADPTLGIQERFASRIPVEPAEPGSRDTPFAGPQIFSMLVLDHLLARLQHQ